MRAWGFALGLATTILAATPAAAADVAQLDCPMSSLSDAQRADLIQFLHDRGASDDPRAQVLLDAVTRCGHDFNWSGRRAQLAFVYSFTSTAAAESRRQLAAAGVDLGGLERRLLADAALRTAVEADLSAPAAIAAFLDRNRNALEAMVRGRPSADALRGWIGIFIASRVALDVSRAEFAAD